MTASLRQLEAELPRLHLVLPASPEPLAAPSFDKDAQWPDVPLSKVPAWPHQRAAFWYAFERRAAMLALSMGLGKSRVVVDLIVNRGHARTLILCPKSVVAAWPKQFALYAARPVRVLALDRGTVADRCAQAQAALDDAAAAGEQIAVVINYDAARLPPFGPVFGRRGGLRETGFALNAGWNLVVCDESQKIKDHGGRTSLFAARLGEATPYRLCLTGTPLAHSPLDLFGQYRFLQKDIFGESYTRFFHEYAVPHPVLREKSVAKDKEGAPRYIRQADFAERMGRIALHISKDDVADTLALPKSLDLTRACQLGAKATKVYKDLEDEFVAALNEDGAEISVANALVKSLRLRQLTGGVLRDDDGVEHALDDAKRSLLSDVLDELPLDEPVVVFAQFRADLDAIRRVAEQQGRSYGELSGRRNDLAAWQASGMAVLGTQVQSGSVGVDLTRARYAIYFSLSWSLAEYEQSRARVHRPGQTRNVTYIHLVAEGTVDETVYEALERRQEVVEAVLDTMRRGKVQA